MESYQTIKARHQAEVNAFPIGAAFSDKQLAEMMQKFGLPNDKTGYAQIVSLGGGCYIMRKDIPAWKEMSKRHEDEIKAMRKDRKELKKALIYEFQNHESQFYRDDETILSCVGLTLEEVNNDEELTTIYNAAWREFYKLCIKNDWF